jgi:S-adenosylmethionine:tRNA ribosyltransferase-isomerase
VVNDTRVIPARIRLRLGGREAEILLLRPATGSGPGPMEAAGGADTWEALVRPGRRFPPGATLALPSDLRVEVEAATEEGRRLRFQPPGRLAEVLAEIGEMPLPPYIHEALDDPERYQTIFSAAPGASGGASRAGGGGKPEGGAHEGSAAAPTAGLHFEPEMLNRLGDAGVEVAAVTLRIGLDTFRPLRVDDLDRHRMHSEAYAIPAPTRAALTACADRGGRVVAVGTTVCRTLEAAAATGRDAGETGLFIRPGFAFRAVDLLLTNFHLPRSTLLVMVSAFSGRDRILAAYAEAVARRYRFFSFGDAMLLERPT